MILIIDAGSTKTDWALVEGDSQVARFATEGFNPNYSDAQHLAGMLLRQAIQPWQHEVQAVYYYGTGCGSAASCNTVIQALKPHFAQAHIHVTHDMMGAARALLGRQQGIACILGTGANACLYDGNNITRKAPSLGYMIGDEGSGGHIGRQLVKAYFYGSMPSELQQCFHEQYQLSRDEFVARLYHHTQPASYVASFASFACQHQSHPFVAQLCSHCFDEFVEAQLNTVLPQRQADTADRQAHFVGSVAFHFAHILEASLHKHGIALGKLLQSPMPGLLKFHQTK